MKIGFLTDLHYRDAVPGTSANPRRECRRVGELLDRCLDALVARDVDLVVCAGDCVDEPDDPRVFEDLAALRDRFAATGRPAIVLPGNHDPAPAAFYGVLASPPRRLRLGGCEVLTFFDDVWQPEIDRARRADDVLEEMRAVLTESPADVSLTLLVQHYVVFPPHRGPGYDHTYENAGAIRTLLEASPRRLVVLSGHDHAGYGPTEHRGVTYLTGRALCEHPYPYYLLDISGERAGDTAVRVQELWADSRPPRRSRAREEPRPGYPHPPGTASA